MKIKNIILATQDEANLVLDSLSKVVHNCGYATVEDLYMLVDISSDHTLHKYGWKDVASVSVTLVEGQGYSLNLPEPELLDELTNMTEAVARETGLSISTCDELFKKGWQFVQSASRPARWESPAYNLPASAFTPIKGDLGGQ